MATVRLQGVGKRFGTVEAVRDVDLHVASGELCCLVGPSGCGKSTLLRLVAGLEGLDTGSIEIAGRRVDELPPAARGVAMVFQSYALYPHMTVFQNMAFGLKLAGGGRQAVRERVAAAARMLQLEGLLERLPRQLSGGQRQRVAIGRAIVREPRVFLFDEPLSNLDAGLRARTRVELARLHARLRATMLYVTHDQAEAMTLADRIAVLRHGRVEQFDTPLAIYRHPANTFVAGFFGSPPMNLLQARLLDGDGHVARVAVAGDAVQEVPAAGTGLAAGAAVTLGIRPEHVRLAGVDDGALRGEVEFCEQLGDHGLAYLSVPGIQTALAVRIGAEERLAAGTPCGVILRAAHCRLFDGAGNACAVSPP